MDTKQKARRTAAAAMNKPWINCGHEQTPGGFNCTLRVYREQRYVHDGMHVAEGRAAGEPDSVVATWAA